MVRILPWLLVGCLGGPAPEGWAPAEATGGPVVVWEPAATPLPEIPFPNDAATRRDPSSPTGRRLNVRVEGTTDHETAVRRAFNELDGFGSFAPLTVSFDEPLDVVDLAARQATPDFRDDAILLLNVDPGCDRFGEEVGLDLGQGRYVATQYGHGRRIPDPLAPDGVRWDPWSGRLFPFDVHFDSNGYHFEERWEDVDGDGRLDAGEDLDGDGVLDVPNFRDPGACADLPRDTLAYDRCAADQLLTFYERETNTVIARPLWPLEERCTHAVLITKRLVGEDGTPVQSPFPAINPRDQTPALERATPFLARYGLALDDLAFAWTFTTGTMTADLRAVRSGLHGRGPFSALGAAFPPDWTLWTRQALAEAFDRTADPAVADDVVLPGACTSDALTTLWDQGLGEWDANLCAVEADLSSVAAWFGGTFAAPDLLVDKDGIATEAYPDDHDERFDLDLVTGEITHGRTDVTFFCALPHEDPEAVCAPGNPDGVPFCKPFPTVIYGHGYGSSRAEFSLHVGRHTAMGQAGCAVDSYGHGLNRWRVDPEASAAIRLSLPAFEAVGVPELAALLSLGRDRDLNNDGLPDGGMDQWTADIFHTRDMVRQSVVEVMQLVRILRHMDGETRDGAGRLLGDVDGDGVVDLGGPRNTVGHWGISLGGILSGVLAGAEPGLDAVSPNAGGGGLTDISTRSTQAGVPEAVVLPMLGQVVVGCLPTDGHDNPLPLGEAGGDDCLRGRGAPGATWEGGTLRIALLGHDEGRLQVREVGALPGVRPGDRLRLENLDNGERFEVVIHGRGWARAAVATDALDAVERRAALGWGDGPGPFRLDDTRAVADWLAVSVWRDGASLGRLEVFEHEVSFQGSVHPAGQPLVALQDGYGYGRNTPDLRRLVGLAQHAISPGDPAVWLQHVHVDPVSGDDPFDDGRTPATLLMPTVGDATVPASTGVAMARAGGFLGSWRRDEALAPEHGWRALWTPDPRYGESVDQWLVDSWVVEGDPRFQRWADFGEAADWNPDVLFDPDDVSDGALRFSCGPSDWSALNGENRCPPAYETEPGEPENLFDVPNPPPGDGLRLDLQRSDGTHDAFRIPMLRPAGQHGIYNAQPFRPFDADAFMVNFTARFLGTRGADVSHEAGCDCSASRPARFFRGAAPAFPGQGVACRDGADPLAEAPATLRVCDPDCAEGWGLRTPERAVCTP